MSEEEDKPKWLWNKNGIFSVKSIYSHLFVEDPDLPNKKLWRAKIPLKIKTFMWLISRNAILTKDKFLKRKWQGDTKCRFCPELETISHMFFECSMAKFVWSLVAMVVGSSCRPCSFDQFWEWVQNTCLLDQNSTWWGWPQSAGPFGELITIFVLKKS